MISQSKSFYHKSPSCVIDNIHACYKSFYSPEGQASTVQIPLFQILKFKCNIKDFVSKRALIKDSDLHLLIIIERFLLYYT